MEAKTETKDGIIITYFIQKGNWKQNNQDADIIIKELDDWYKKLRDDLKLSIACETWVHQMFVLPAKALTKADLVIDKISALMPDWAINGEYIIFEILDMDLKDE